MTPAPSGHQWTIRHGAHEATVVEIGGGLRTLTLDGLPGIAGYAEDEVCRSCRGQVLLPWPNRIRDGRYTFAGVERRLALTEPERRVALHGLVTWLPWRRRDRDVLRPDEVVVGTRLPPQPGWDWWFDVEVTYRLADDGLTVDTTVTNLDRAPAPFGYAAHPYLALRGRPVGSATLTIPAAAHLPVDPDRLLPTGPPRPVTADLDFRTARAMGTTALDTAYTELDRNPDGRWEVTLGGSATDAGTDTGGVTLWAGEGFDWVQVYNGPMQPVDRPIDGVAVEPMTCAPDAFNTGVGLRTLAPGERWIGRWGIASAR